MRVGKSEGTTKEGTLGYRECRPKKEKYGKRVEQGGNASFRQRSRKEGEMQETHSADKVVGRGQYSANLNGEGRMSREKVEKAGDGRP